MNIIYLAIIAMLFSCISYAQTQFWSDTFEDAGAPSSGTRTPSVQNSFGSPASRYFFRTDAVPGVSVLLQNGAYSGMQGSKCWAAEDIDAALTGSNFGQTPNQDITWTSINIAGKVGLSFKGLFACDNTSPTNWEGASIPPADFMIVEYRIDGGPWTSSVRFFSTSALNGMLAQETTGDELAFGEGPALSKTFTEYTGTITGTGTTLDLRFRCSANGATVEELAIDNFRLFTSTTLPLTLVSFSGKATGNGVSLQWETEDEINTDGFDIERSTTSNNFTAVGTVPSKPGSGDYSYTDQQVEAGKNYLYRLKMRDKDGRYTYSSTLAILAKASGNMDNFLVFPNPVTSTTLFVQPVNTLEKNILLTVADLNGKTYYTKNIPVSNGRIEIPVQTLAAGIYILKISNSKKILQVTKFKK
ncbi:MAG: gliding motility-related protein [Chitinophagaceae bacterium]|nr:gliding motility-related protein [Chitinophagaceae bacterium]